MDYRKKYGYRKGRKMPGIVCSDACYFQQKVIKSASGELQNVIYTYYDDGTVETKAINSGFVFLFLPIQEDFPPLLLFFMIDDSGHFKEDIHGKVVEKIRKEL